MRAAPIEDAPRMGELALAFAAARHPREVHRALFEFVRAGTSMNSFFIASFDAASRMRTCEFAFSDGAEQDVSRLPAMALNENHASQALVEARTVLARDLDRVLARVAHVDMGLDVDPRLPKVALVVPMVAHESTLGYLEIQSCEPNAFDERDVVTLETAARLAALALENLTLQAREKARLTRVEERLHSQVVARGLVRSMLARLAQRSHLPAQSLRELGRELGAGVDARDVEGYLAAYEEMGLGHVRLDIAQTARFTFTGRDLIERGRSIRPTCYLTLGSLEGAAETMVGKPMLGTEIACQSQEHAACRFIVGPRLQK